MAKPPETVEERLAFVEGQAMAHHMVLQYVVLQTWPHPTHRNVTREAIVAALTRRYGDSEPTDRAHGVFRAAVDEIERLFRSDASGPRPDPA